MQQQSAASRPTFTDPRSIDPTERPVQTIFVDLIASSSHREDQLNGIRAMSVPERAENCGHQWSPTGTVNGLRSGQAQVDPLRETTF
jgi:hypothetical protein